MTLSNAMAASTLRRGYVMRMGADAFNSTIAALEAAACDPAAACSVDSRCLQDLIAAVVRVYSARRAAGQELPALRPNADGTQPTATDVVIMVTALLDSAQ